MSSIDELFKASGVGGNKRKIEPLKDPNEVYKSAKLAQDDSGAASQRNERAGSNNDDTEAGPADATGDGDYGPELPLDDDEDGRFFGGGITRQESAVLDYMDDGEGDAPGPADKIKIPDKYDKAWLRKTALNFERHISKNAELRAKYESEPQRFIASEADLDADIKALSILAEHPDLYPEFARLGCVASLVSLLAHENTDIAIDVIEIINELTDEEVIADDNEWSALVDALLDAGLLGLLVSNLERLNEKDEDLDRNGVYYALSILENLCSRSDTSERIADHKQLLEWLLRRCQARETPVSQNKQYAAEILAILVYSSSHNRRAVDALNAADIMLQLLAAYRKRDPVKGGNEEEYVMNLFQALTSLVDEPTGKAKFLEAEGVELCLIMAKEAKMAKFPAMRLLEHVTSHRSPSQAKEEEKRNKPDQSDGAAAQVQEADSPETGTTGVCLRIVEAGGLKTLFTLFMKKSEHRITDHVLHIFSNMLHSLPSGSDERIRLLAKFVEKNYEKIGKLLAMRRIYLGPIAEVEQRIEQQKVREGIQPSDYDLFEASWVLARLDAGLWELRVIDTILAWLIAEDDGARDTISRALEDDEQDLDDIRGTLQEQISEMKGRGQDAEMLTALVKCFGSDIRIV